MTIRHKHCSVHFLDFSSDVSVLTTFQCWYRQQSITSSDLLCLFLNQCDQLSVRLVDRVVFRPGVRAAVGAAVWTTDWPLGTRVWRRPLDTRRMRDVRWCWQIVTFLVSCQQDSHHFLLEPVKRNWELEETWLTVVFCTAALFILSMSGRGSEQVKLNQDGKRILKLFQGWKCINTKKKKTFTCCLIWHQIRVFLLDKVFWLCVVFCQETNGCQQGKSFLWLSSDNKPDLQRQQTCLHSLRPCHKVQSRPRWSESLTPTGSR